MQVTLKILKQSKVQWLWLAGGLAEKTHNILLTLKTVGRVHLLYTGWKILLSSESSEGWAGTGQEFSSFPLKAERLRQTQSVANERDVQGNLATGLRSWRGQFFITLAALPEDIFWGSTGGGGRGHSDQAIYFLCLDQFITITAQGRKLFSVAWDGECLPVWKLDSGVESQLAQVLFRWGLSF